MITHMVDWRDFGCVGNGIYLRKYVPRELYDLRISVYVPSNDMSIEESRDSVNKC